MNNRINILYQFDEKYAPYAGISMLSLLEHNQGNKVYIYAIAMEVSKDNKEKIKNTCEIYKTNLIWLEADEILRQIEELKVGKWNDSYATWYKVFMLEHIPTDVNRLLYIDCDTIVTGDLSELFNFDMRGKSIAAVMDCLTQHACGRLNVERYYNAGVTLYNMENMREQGMIEGMLAHLKKNVQKYIVNDQDLLNDYFKNDIYTLPLRYNMQGFLYMFNTVNYLDVYKYNYFYKKEDITCAKDSPIIVHFFRILGDYPWEKNNLHACKKIYNEWKNKSFWKEKGELDRKIELVFIVEKVLYKILPQKVFLRLYRKIVE